MSVFDEFRAHASLPFEQARMLPLEAYASAEVLDAELATLFAAIGSASPGPPTWVMSATTSA